MQTPKKDLIFDTLIDTKKFYVAIKANFTLREYQLTDGRTPVVLTITGNRQRERIPLPHITIDTKYWDRDKQRLKAITAEFVGINLMLDNIITKVTAIKTNYHLSERVLTPELVRKEFLSDMPRVLFPSFFKSMLEEEKVMMKDGTYRRHKSVLKKLTKYNKELTFMEIDYMWFEKYKRHLAKLGNQKTTIAANVISIKKFLLLAQKSGIRLRVNLDEIISGSTKGNRTALAPSEVKKLVKFYNSEFINHSWRLVLGYFLFSCMTGLRISDVQKLKRKDFADGFVSIVTQKTDKNQSITLNDTVLKIISREPMLFVDKYSDKHLNFELKNIMKVVGITKVVTFHVARHTFATSFIRAGGSVPKLQMLLGHESISQTMIYVHMIEAEANSEIHLLDELFK